MLSQVKGGKIKKRLIFSFVLFLATSFFFFIQNIWAGSLKERDEYIKGVLSKFEESSPAVIPNIKKEAPQKKHTFEGGSEVYHYTYKEPGLMRYKGIWRGFNFAYTFRGQMPPVAKNGMVKVESRYCWGRVDYDGHLLDEARTPFFEYNIPQYMFETRALFGNEFFVSETVSFIPYLGLGYRYLKDNSPGMERRQHYYYMPLGLEVIKRLKRNWSIGMQAELDLFCGGRQITYRANLGEKHKFRQTDGIGLRGAFKIQNKTRFVDFNFEPFIRYWHIDDSKLGPPVEGEEDLYWFEPKNLTRELGFKLALVF